MMVSFLTHSVRYQGLIMARQKSNHSNVQNVHRDAKTVI